MTAVQEELLSGDASSGADHAHAIDWSLALNSLMFDYQLSV